MPWRYGGCNQRGGIRRSQNELLLAAMIRSALSGVPNSHNAKLIDLQIASIDLRMEGPLMAPISRTTHRNYFTEAVKV
jgi:hypothetical protein